MAIISEAETLAEIQARQLAKTKEYMQQVPGIFISFACIQQNEDVIRLVVGDSIENELLFKGHLILSVGGLHKLQVLCEELLAKMDRGNAERAKGLN